jgi:hypothetical protein
LEGFINNTELGEVARGCQTLLRRFISKVLWMGCGCGLEPNPETEMPQLRKKGRAD